MTQEHLTDQQVEAYRQRAVDTSARDALASHLAVCEACLQRVINTAHFNVAFTALKESFLSPTDEEPFHLSRGELKRYRAGNLEQADRTIFESHLEDCAECSRLAQELLLVSPNVAAEQSKPAPQTAWKSLTAYWRRPTYLRPVYIGGIALVCALLLIFWLQSKYSGGRNQTAAGVGAQDQSQPAMTPQINQGETPPGEETVNNGGSVENEGSGGDKGTLSSPSAPRSASEIIVSLIDGQQAVTMDRQGNLRGLEGVAVPVQRVVSQALLAKEIKRPETLNELSAPRITLLGQPSSGLPFALLEPAGVVSLNDRPTFRWQPLKGATNYTVFVFDSDFNRVLKSEPQAATNWTVPTPLNRGSRYFWEVTAHKDGQEITSPVAPAPRAQFKIVDEETLREINQVREARPGSHLTLGLIYARVGLLDDAEREFQLLVNANPRSEIARKFLRRVRSWKRP